VFLPLDLYERDRRRAERLREGLGAEADPTSPGLRFVLSHPHVCLAILGFRTPAEVANAATDSTCLAAARLAALLDQVGIPLG
jgi:hypothetical protein